MSDSQRASMLAMKSARLQYSMYSRTSVENHNNLCWYFMLLAAAYKTGDFV